MYLMNLCKKWRKINDAMYKLKLVTTLEDLEIWKILIENISQDQLVTIAHNPCLPNILAETFGFKSASYLIWDDEKVIGALPGILIGDKFASLPHFSYGGPLCINKHIERIKISELFPKQKYDIRSFHILSDFYSNEKVTCYLKLQNTVDGQWNSFKSKLRSQIKKGENYGHKVYNGGIELLSDFYMVYTQNMLRLGSPPLPKIFFKNILDNYKFGNVNITVVKYNNLSVASGMTLTYMGFKEVCWASSNHRYNKFNVNMVLYWEIIKKAIIDGNKIFSFGRSSKESNTLKFKLQWDPEVVPIYFNYSHQLSFSIKKMTFLSKLWSIQPNYSAIFFGKYISKYMF